jgi:hypothetical protein
MTLVNVCGSPRFSRFGIQGFDVAEAPDSVLRYRQVHLRLVLEFAYLFSAHYRIDNACYLFRCVRGVFEWQ